MIKNDLFYADNSNLIAITADKRIIRNISRSQSTKNWLMLGVTKQGKNAGKRYFIPVKDRLKAERRLNLKARKIG